MKRFTRIAVIFIVCSLSSFGRIPSLGDVSAADRSVDMLFIDAQKAIARGDYDGAEALLSTALDRDPSFTAAIWQLAQIHESRGRMELAREFLARGLALDPSAAWAAERLAALDERFAASLLDEARRGLADGDHRRAAEHLDRARAVDPTNPELARLDAELEAHRRARRIDRLVRDAKGALAETETAGTEPARKALGLILAADERHSWAIEELRRLDEREAAAKRPPEPAAAPRIEETPAEVTSATDAGTTGTEPEETAPRASRSLWYLLSALAAACGALFALVRRRAAGERYPLEGSISVVPMLDLVTLVNSNRRTGVLSLEGDRTAGELFFESGEIVHARCGNFAGTQAFRRLMALRAGRFRFHNRLPTTRRTITEPFSTLLLSLERRDDPPPSAHRQSDVETVETPR